MVTFLNQLLFYIFSYKIYIFKRILKTNYIILKIYISTHIIYIDFIKEFPAYKLNFQSKKFYLLISFDLNKIYIQELIILKN